jgi:hypothetical protein
MIAVSPLTAAPVTRGVSGHYRLRARVQYVRESAPVYGAAPGVHLHQIAPDEGQLLTTLGEEIMTLSEQVHVSTQRLLVLIAEFDRRQGWKVFGFGSCPEWLAYSTGLDKITAREKVRVARALPGSPRSAIGHGRSTRRLEEPGRRTCRSRCI